MDDKFEQTPNICTMRSMTNICKIPPRGNRGGSSASGVAISAGNGIVAGTTSMATSGGTTVVTSSSGNCTVYHHR